MIDAEHSAAFNDGHLSEKQCCTKGADLKKLRAKPWVDNRGRTATPQQGKVGLMGLTDCWPSSLWLRPGPFQVRSWATPPAR
jgi:hypothetical protein